MRETSKINQRRTHALRQKQREDKIAQGWQFSDEYHGAGLPLVEGRRFKFKPKDFVYKGVNYGIVSRAGWYKFRQYVVHPNGTEWVECSGPYAKSGSPKTGCGFHAFETDCIVQVERKLKDPIEDHKARKEEELG
jgi:hypothetical protein